MPRLLRLLMLTSTLLAASFLAGCGGSSSNEHDADSDGLTDAQEELQRSITVTREEGVVTLRVTSDPQARDTDGDGLEDLDEFVRQTDPRDPDTDRDGLLDGFNVTLDANDPRVAAWRAAGILEDPPLTFLGELSFCRPLGLKSAQYSSDRPFSDKLGDGDELRGWNVTVRGETTRVFGDPCTADEDQDGATDDMERDMGTHPQVADTDGDGALDGYDADPLWDLRLRIANVTITPTNATDARLAVSSGSIVEEVDVDAARGANLVVDVQDVSTVPGSLDTSVLLAVTTTDGTPLHVFPRGNSAVLRVDLIQGTATLDGASSQANRFDAQGEDGSISFTYETVRT